MSGGREGRLDSGELDFDFAGARAAAFEWFAVLGRRFPWREAPTPYRVWVSEMMLQQTTTQTVLGYFSRFMDRFPDVAALATSAEDEILKFWEGLGYYRRAKALRAGAIQIVERFGGVFPEKFDEILSLPGVGRYATGAILSFGYNRRAAILEANTTRLHARLLALRDEPTTTAAQRTLWRFAEDWLPPENSVSPPDYRSLNAALIDLGRLVCAPTEPRCDVCPLARFCAAFAAGLENELPARKEKMAPIPRMDVAFWISRRDLFPEAPETTAENASNVLLIRRPQDALWAGLWDFPKFELAPENLAGRDSADFDSAAVADWLQLFLEETIGAPSFDYRPGPVLTTVKHSVTRYRTTLYLCRLRATPPTSARVSRRLGEATLEWRWTPLADLAETPLSSPGRKLARFVALESAPAASRGRLF